METANWYFGWNAGVDFRSGTPVALMDGALHTGEGCSAISDGAGNLLFYTDGITVWDRSHNPMPNGTGLLGDESSTQSALIVPRPETPNGFYIFTVDKQAGPKGMNYSEVDMTLNGGLGDVTTLKNVNLMPYSTEKVTAVQSQDGTGIWVIGHPWESDSFHSYFVSSTGVNTTPVVSVTPLRIPLNPGDNSNFSAGQLKVSPNGSQLAMCSITYGSQLFDFDPQSGVIRNMIQISDRKFDYGVEFSPSGRVLYIGSDPSTIEGKIYQYDLTAPSIADSEILIATGYGLGAALQLALDGKIYTPDVGANLHSIDNPDLLGLACNFNYRSVDLNGRWARAGLPPFIQSYFYVDMKIENLCFGDLTEFTSSVTGTITNINWDFGDGNSSTEEKPTHIYSNPGTYTVSVTATTATETKTETKEITIYDNPVAHPVTDYAVCSETPTYQFDFSTKDIEVLGGQSPVDFSVVYYATQADAESGINPLPALYTNTNDVETVYARVNNSNNSSCFDITSFDLVVKEAPVLNSVTDWIICDTDDDGLYSFDLSLKNIDILGSQDAATFGISYFETKADADTGTNVIGPNYTNTASPQEVFFRIENTAYPGCYKIGSFSLEVITGVTANIPSDYEVCDTDNDGIQTFDLLSKNAEIIGSQNPGSISVSYHTSQQDTETGMNAVNSMYTNTNPYSETIYVRVENTSNPDCYDTTTLNLAVYDVPVLQEVSNWQVCDSDNDGIYFFELSEKDAVILGNQPGTEFSVSYHLTGTDAQKGQNAVAGTFENTTNPQQLFYRVENMAHPDCYITGSFSVQVFDTPTAYTDTPLMSCDLEENGIQSFDLSTRDEEILGQQDPGAYSVAYFSNEQDAQTYQNALPKQAYLNVLPQETIYARVSHNSNSACYAISSFEIIVNPLPQPVLEETYIICPDSPELTIDGGNFESWSWENVAGTEIWNGQYFSVSELGSFTLTVSQTQNGITCEKTLSFEVVSSGAPDSFTYDLNGFSDQIELVIEATGVGEFEYSLDGQNYQDQNEFTVFPGTYTVFVRDKYECRTINQEIVAIGYLRFFTPNGDGRHEHWNIIGGDLYTDAALFIYDRYGKLLKQLALNSPGWDGTYQGKPLPSADYWFRYEYDNGKAVTGHFALKR